MGSMIGTGHQSHISFRMIVPLEATHPSDSSHGLSYRYNERESGMTDDGWKAGSKLPACHERGSAKFPSGWGVGLRQEVGTNSFCTSPGSSRNGKVKNFRAVDVARGGCCDEFGDWYDLGAASMRLTVGYSLPRMECSLQNQKKEFFGGIVVLG